MKNIFLITNSKQPTKSGKIDLPLVRHEDGISVFSNVKFSVFDNILILIDGFVVPRNEIFNEYQQFDQYELVFKLYKKFGKKFPIYLKGFFCIAIIDDNEAYIINDIHSVKRCYFGHRDGNTYISNDLKSFSKLVDLNFNRNSPIIMALLQHFIQGMTQFDNICYSEPSSIFQINSKEFLIDKYYRSRDLIYLDRSKFSRNDLIDVFVTSIRNYITYLNPRVVSATLTGGRDTRTILAVLLHFGIDPHCFTFGLPSGTDVKTAKLVANKCELAFSNHYIEELNSDTYSKLVSEILNLNSPQINLHRAHRLDAIFKESQCQKGNLDMIFVGAMGGDYIMGEHFNDYILTEFLRRFLTEKSSEKIIISDILKKHFIKFDGSTIDFVLKYLESLNLHHNKFDKNVEFNLVHNIIGCSHDIQDINLFLEKSKYVIAPFMDIDIMEALFSSKMSLFSNTRHTKNPFKRLKGAELQCQIIKQFAPRLADIPFANLYTPNDVLGNKYFYILKRIYLQSTKAPSFPTFKYDLWFHDFISKNIESNEEFIDQYYDLGNMKKNFQESTHKTTEGYWHKFSNPINLALYFTNLK